MLGNALLSWRAACVVIALVLLSGCGDNAPSEQVDGKTQAFWTRQLDEYSPGAKVEALAALARFKEPPLELIAGYLDDSARSVRAGAMAALGSMGPAAVAYAEPLAKLLEETPEGVDERTATAQRNAAIAALGAMGPGALKHFSHMLASEKAIFRFRAVHTIRPFVKDLKDGINTVLPLMKDEHVSVRRAATKTLGAAAAGSNDRRASEALMLAMEDLDPQVATSAAIALGGAGGSADIEGKALSKGLYAHRQDVRAAAAYALGLMGEEASPYLRQLADLLKNDNRHMVRIQAARAHYRISGSPDAALPQLEKEVQSSDLGLCRDAIKAIGEMGAAGAPALGSLLPFLERPGLRVTAARAMGAIGPAAKSALPELAKAAEASAGADRKEIEQAQRAITGE